LAFTEGSTFHLFGHLWIIVSDLSQSTSEIVIVNISTYRNKSYEDTACLLQPAEHKFIVQQSYVVYGRARLVDLPKLETWFRTGELRMSEDASLELLHKVRAGAKGNDFLPYKIERVLSMQNLI